MLTESPTLGAGAVGQCDRPPQKHERLQQEIARLDSVEERLRDLMAEISGAGRDPSAKQLPAPGMDMLPLAGFLTGSAEYLSMKIDGMHQLIDTIHRDLFDSQ